MNSTFGGVWLRIDACSVSSKNIARDLIHRIFSAHQQTRSVDEEQGFSSHRKDGENAITAEPDSMSVDERGNDAIPDVLSDMKDHPVSKWRNASKTFSRFQSDLENAPVPAKLISNRWGSLKGGEQRCFGSILEETPPADSVDNIVKRLQGLTVSRVPIIKSRMLRQLQLSEDGRLLIACSDSQSHVFEAVSVGEVRVFIPRKRAYPPRISYRINGSKSIRDSTEQVTGHRFLRTDDFS